MYKKPKNDDKYEWTNHSVDKMAYYRISESLVKRIARFPKRVETGVAPNTTACMQSTGSKKRPSEVWIMFQEMSKKPISNCKLTTENCKLKIISAWRYPGVSKVGEPIPIPEEILSELAAD